MLPDLVRDSKLSTQILGSETIHTYQESDPTSGNRLIARTEHWQRKEKIGNGAYGSVWLEKCTKGQRGGNQVRAVKQSHLDSRSGPVDYTRELEIIAKFSRSNYARCFVKSFGWYENSGNICIAMEYLERGDLRDYLDDSKSPLSENDSKEITFQILEGLDMMHQNSFAHRDLKPQNILIQSHPPNKWWVKLADFGISKRIEEASGGSTLHGTPGYIAPEIWKLTARGSPYAPDVWALGETAYQLLTKEPAFPNIALLVSYVSNSDNFPVDALKKSGTIQGGIDFVRSLLHPLPSNRPTAPEAISHKWIERKSLEIPKAKPSQPDHAGLENYPRAFASTSEDFASLNTKISIPEPKSIPPKKSPAMSTLPEENAEAKTVIELKRSHRSQSSTSNSFRGKLRRRDKLEECFSDWVSHISFSPDGKTLAAGSGNTISLWDTESPTEQNSKVLIQSKPVHTLAFSLDGKYLASGSRNTDFSVIHSISLWELSSLTKFAQFTEFDSRYQEYTKYLCFSPDNTLLASGHSTGTVFVWRIDDPKHLLYTKSCKKLLGVTFLPNGDLLFVDSTGIYTWKFTSKTLHKTTFPGELNNKKVWFSSDRTYFVYRLSANHKFEFRHTANGKVFRSLKYTVRDKIICMDLSPNGQVIAGTVYNGKHAGSRLVVWDAMDGKELHVVKWAHGRKAGALAFSPRNQMLATGCHGGILRTWEDNEITQIASPQVNRGEETLSTRSKLMTFSVE